MNLSISEIGVSRLWLPIAFFYCLLFIDYMVERILWLFTVDILINK